jgi:uncharacterized protein YdaU (DUF1376 family)
MPSFPYMRLFVGDYLGDTRHLTTLEHGAYLLLLMAYWQRGKALPHRDADLAHIAGVTRPQWTKMKPKIAEFFDVSCAKFVHHRVEQEIQHSLDKSLKSQRAGSASVKRRLNGRSTIPAPEPEPERRTPQTPQGGAGLFQLEVEDEAPDFEVWWREYPNKVGKGAAEKAFGTALEKLSGSSHSKTAQLVFSLRAQLRVWARKGIAGKFIPHPSTWLNQSRWTDDEVVAEATRKIRPRAPEPELSPADPPPAPEERAVALPPAGWRPSDD